MARRSEPKEERHGVSLSSLDTELAADTGVTKRALVDYLDAVAERMLPELRDRPLSVIRSTRGQQAFMQKNLPTHAPGWITREPMWAESSQRTVDYAVCNDARTLIWFANQRAVEYHVPLVRLEDLDAPTHLVVDLDPPEGDGFGAAARAAHQVRTALSELGLEAAVKASGAKGVHVVVPIEGASSEDASAATRAIAARTERLDPKALTTEFLKDDRGGRVFLDATRSGLNTVVAVYSPRLRPGAPVSWPLTWDELDGFDPRDVTITSAIDLIGERDPWTSLLPAPQRLPAELVTEGNGIPVPRVAAMHEGKRRRAARGVATS
ncbi:MAG TPA: non-homologous end-joining DNA ligase [Ilumatobacter sp.]|nr:non-homologous end-joining DNA ligase [Ilumatobacter sp.]